MPQIDKNIRLRVGNVELRTSLPLFVRDKDRKLKEPTEENRYLEIVHWWPNTKYNKQGEYVRHERENGKGYYYTDPNEEFPIRYDESCFMNPETCCSIARYNYDEKEDLYELRFVGNRPLDLEDDDFNDFVEVIRKAKDIIETQVLNARKEDSDY